MKSRLLHPTWKAKRFLSSTAIEDYKDAWRFALGANYRFTDLFMLRIGGGYDQTPTIDAQRDVRLPGCKSLGSQYRRSHTSTPQSWV